MTANSASARILYQVHLPTLYMASGFSLKVVNNNSFFTKTNISFSRNKKKNFVEIYPEGMQVALWEKPQSTYIYSIEHHSVCPLVGIGTPPPL
jgi:hypothetical protein